MLNLVRECLKEGREFLYRHDLRNLTYVNLLPQSGKNDIAKRLIESTEATWIEKGFMYDIFNSWQGHCHSQGDPGYLYLLKREGEIYVRIRDLYLKYEDGADDYLYAYDEQGELTPQGRAVRVAAGTRYGANSPPR